VIGEQGRPVDRLWGGRGPLPLTRALRQAVLWTTSKEYAPAPHRPRPMCRPHVSSSVCTQAWPRSPATATEKPPASRTARPRVNVSPRLPPKARHWACLVRWDARRPSRRLARIGDWRGDSPVPAAPSGLSSVEHRLRPEAAFDTGDSFRNAVVSAW